MDLLMAIQKRIFNNKPSNNALPVFTKKRRKYWITFNENIPIVVIISRCGRTCGFIKLIWHNDKLELIDVNLIEKYRNHGLGTKLIQWLISFSAKKKMTCTQAHVSPEDGFEFNRLMAWYLRQGFKRLSPNSTIVEFVLNKQ